MIVLLLVDVCHSQAETTTAATTAAATTTVVPAATTLAGCYALTGEYCSSQTECVADPEPGVTFGCVCKAPFVGNATL